MSWCAPRLQDRLVWPSGGDDEASVGSQVALEPPVPLKTPNMANRETTEAKWFNRLTRGRIHAQSCMFASMAFN